jgi:hypothetical protein
MAPAKDTFATDLSEYRQHRLSDLGKALHTETSEEQKDNIRAAINLYEKKELPGPRGKYHFIYIQDGQICSIKDLDGKSPN